MLQGAAYLSAFLTPEVVACNSFLSSLLTLPRVVLAPSALAVPSCALHQVGVTTSSAKFVV
jgi:hypothetical protein